jgi:REP element-mobilizing transposase RayT
MFVCPESPLAGNELRYANPMAHTYVTNLVHCIFSTKERGNTISDPPRLWEYVGGIARQRNFILLAAGGTANHLHLLIALPAALPLSKAVQELKGNTSRWLNEISLLSHGSKDTAPSALASRKRKL